MTKHDALAGFAVQVGTNLLRVLPGVRDAIITTFRRPHQDHDPSMVRDSIAMRPTELAVIASDPANPNNQRGKSTISRGKGGFIDT